MQLCMQMCYIIKVCSLFRTFLTSHSDVDFGNALVFCWFIVVNMYRSVLLQRYDNFKV
jgi:hypothetical protein